MTDFHCYYCNGIWTKKGPDGEYLGQFKEIKYRYNGENIRETIDAPTSGICEFPLCQDKYKEQLEKIDRIAKDFRR